MMILAPELNMHLRNSVIPQLKQFSDCFKGSVLTLGRRSIAISESVNNMLKTRLPNRILTVVESNQLFTNICATKMAFQVYSLTPMMSSYPTA
jgi:hypothetical protein